jgi:hypothetical protein
MEIMTRTEDYELLILRELAARDLSGHGGMTAVEIKKLFHTTIGRNKAGEKFFRHMMDYFMTFRMVNGQTCFFPTVLGKFRLRDLENQLEDEKLKSSRLN